MISAEEFAQMTDVRGVLGFIALTPADLKNLQQRLCLSSPRSNEAPARRRQPRRRG